MWAALGNLLKNMAIKEAKKTAIGAAAGDESSQKKILIVIIAVVSLFLVIIVVILSVIFGPILLAEQYVEDVGNDTYLFFEKIGNVLTFHGWCADSDGSCSKKAEQKFYEQLDSVYTKYKDDGVNLDVDLLTATIFYGNTLNDNLFIDEDSSMEGDIPEISGTDFEDIKLSDVRTLASKMVSGNRIDYNKYRNYLVNTYIPKRFSDMYNSGDSDIAIERIADEIMAFATDYNKSSSSQQFSYISSLCPEICLTSGQCYELDDYIAGVVEGESGMFKSLIPNHYQEQWKAQAVAARTYALAVTNWCKLPIQNSQNNQVFKNGPYHDEIKEVISETAGQVLTYDGEVFEAEYDSFFFGNNFHCDGEYCYATYDKRGPTGLPTISHEIKAYAKWRNGFAGGHGRGMSQYGAAYLADIGWPYEQILEYFYANGVEISKIGGTYASGEFTEELLFPLAMNSKNGQCVSAGNYYPGGSYHGAVDIAGWNMGYPDTSPTQIPVIASIGGKIVSLSNNNWCTSRYDNGDKRLPVVQGCQGNYLTIVVTDSSSKYYNYSFVYFHFDKVDPNLKIGDTVEKGQFLGYMGSTGNSTGYHLHFDIRDSSGAHVNSTPIPDQITNMIANYCKNNIAEGS